jgi:glycosyltransferase involved in cell wall biosynthesis
VDDPGEVFRDMDREGINRILTGHRWRFLEPIHLKCWNRNLGWAIGGVCRSIARHLGIGSHVGWIKAAEKACSALKPKDVDIILASGSPFEAFTVAQSLSNRLGRPYVLDYRDPWTGNPYASRQPRRSTMKKEASLLEGSAAITIVSPSWAAALDRCYGVGAKLHVITNGYDPAEMADVKAYNFGHCAIVYTGNFYAPKRIITPFMAALKHLRYSLDTANHEWYFHYYGVYENYIREQASRFGLNDRIVLHGRVPRAEALSAVKGANLSVVITSVDEQGSLEEKGMVTGKIYESIGLGTPTLLITPSGSDATDLTQESGLVRSFTGMDSQGMASFLKDVVTGRVLPPGDTHNCSWTTISKKLDAILRNSILENPHV